MMPLWADPVGISLDLNSNKVVLKLRVSKHPVLQSSTTGWGCSERLRLGIVALIGQLWQREITCVIGQAARGSGRCRRGRRPRDLFAVSEPVRWFEVREPRQSIHAQFVCMFRVIA